jgi:peptidoglycan/LPS O-acetylase OafA/YrhL
LWAWAFTVFPPYSALAPYIYALLPFGAGLLLFSALPFNRQPLDVFLSSGPMVQIGKLSYSLYLVHLPVLMALNFPIDRPISYNIFFFVFVFATAYCLHTLIEKPVLLLKDHIAPTTERLKLPTALTVGLILAGIFLYLLGR